MTPPTVTLARLGEIAGVEPTRMARAPSPTAGSRSPASARGSTCCIARCRRGVAGDDGGSPLIVPPGPLQWSTAEVTVDGEDVTSVALSPQPAITIAGRLAFEGARPAPDARRACGCRPAAPGRRSATFQVPLPQIQLEPGGRFVVAGILPGVYRLGALPSQPMQGIRAPIGALVAEVDRRQRPRHPRRAARSPAERRRRGRDVHGPGQRDVRHGEGRAGRRRRRICSSSSSAPIARRGSSTRAASPAFAPTPQGRYAIRNLPPGEYRIVATADLEQSEWFDPAVLERLLAGGDADHDRRRREEDARSDRALMRRTAQARALRTSSTSPQQAAEWYHPRVIVQGEIPDEEVSGRRRAAVRGRVAARAADASPRRAIRRSRRTRISRSR